MMQLHLSWPRMAAITLWLTLCLLWISIRVAPPTPTGLLLGWSLAVQSWLILSPLLCLTLLPGYPGRSLSGCTILLLGLAMTWHLASTERYFTQSQWLTWHDLQVVATSPLLRRHLTSAICSWAGMAYWAASILLIVGGTAVLRRQSAKAYCISLALPMALLLLPTSIFKQDCLAEAQGTIAPWSTRVDSAHITTICDPESAMTLRSPKNPLWTAEPHPIRARLSQTQRQQSILIIIMESQRLADIDRWGADSTIHQPCSPHLAALMDRHTVFRNAYQNGQTTESAKWSLLTGLPFTPSVMSAGTELVDLGPAAAFKDAGYELSWLQTADPDYQGLIELTSRLGMPCGVTPEEAAQARHQDDSRWSSWGMPDDQLFTIARHRINGLTSSDKPYLQVILTVSNHRPFAIPDTIDGTPLTKDYHGGMRFTDHELSNFLDWLGHFPQEQQPLIYITADTGHREDVDSLLPLRNRSPEAFRIPAVLIDPDDPTHRVIDVPLGHQDVLDLLGTRCGIADPRIARWKFTTHQRIGLQSCFQEGDMFISTDHILTRGDALRFDGPWSLTPSEPMPALRNAWLTHLDLLENTWIRTR